MAGSLSAEDLTFYIGTYTGGASQGIYRSSLDTESGKVAPAELVAKVTNPSFLCITPDGKRLVSVGEVAAGQDGAGRQVQTFTIQEDGSLEPLSGAGSEGSGPCYVSTDSSGKFALVANYGSGSIASIAIQQDGKLGSTASKIQHAGSSQNPGRQSGPHAHCITVDPSGKYVCAVDLGIDKVVVYRFDSQTGKLVEHDATYTEAPGNGPRHIAFHPDGKHAFVICELSSQLSVCSWDAKQGKLTKLQSVSSLPKDFQEQNSTAEVLVHPNGKFVYGSNRGKNSIALFQFDPASEACQLIENTSSGGKTPRNFRIDPTGKFLLAENQNSDSIIVFRIDQATGRLTRTEHEIEVGSPCCIKFMPSPAGK